MSELEEWKQAASVEAGLRREFLARALAAEVKLDEAMGIIYDLLGLEAGSGERAMKFLDEHSPTMADVKGILPLSSSEKATNNEQERQ